MKTVNYLALVSGCISTLFCTKDAAVDCMAEQIAITLTMTSMGGTDPVYITSEELGVVNVADMADYLDESNYVRGQVGIMMRAKVAEHRGTQLSKIPLVARVGNEGFVSYNYMQLCSAPLIVKLSKTSELFISVNPDVLSTSMYVFHMRLPIHLNGKQLESIEENRPTSDVELEGFLRQPGLSMESCAFACTGIREYNSDLDYNLTVDDVMRLVNIMTAMSENTRGFSRKEMRSIIEGKLPEFMSSHDDFMFL